VDVVDTIVVMQDGLITQSRPVEKADSEDIAHYIFGQ
jgi:ABC-type sugar transport system ATPase subunit